LSLSFTDTPSYAVELDTHNPANPVIWMRGPIGLDGLYRKSAPTSFGLRAVKGAWVSGDTFAVDVQFVGSGEQQKFSLSFSGDNKVVLRGKAGEAGRSRLTVRPAAERSFGPSLAHTRC
jgi:hypothetical protein